VQGRARVTRHPGQGVAMDLELQGKVAIVTGASKGLGLALMHARVAEGASVIAGARDIADAGARHGIETL
jgi:NAD(P)-dependent dehydrogenase (short-subunit alcohol dehydrogenase family)